VSVIDLVKGNLDSFVKTLGANDKVAVSNHLDLIRDIEKKIASEPPETGGVCQKPVDQGADPNSNVERYSDENKRAEIFVDLAHMALVCDLHRTAALILSREQSFMNTKEINSSQNFDSTLHDLTHNGSNKVPEYLAYAIQWHVNQFSRLAKKLKDTPEGNGTALDNTAMVFYMEAGHVNSGTGNPHTGDNMFMLVAGGKNLGVNTGVHIKANQDSGAKVFTSLMDLYGAGNKLGSVSGKINGLTS
jgi:hypothetical protein